MALGVFHLARSVPVRLFSPIPEPGLAGDDSVLRRFEAKLAQIAAQVDARIGIAALHVETGRGVSLNGTERFPMASTVKVPIAVQLLTLVDRGELHTDSMVGLEPRHIHPGQGLISRKFCVPGVALSVRNLLELMLVESDNSACDVLFDLAGADSGVNTRLYALGIDDISVDRPSIRLLADYAGVTDLPAEGPITEAQWEASKAAVPPERKVAAWSAFLHDLRDTATPEAMVRLLSLIARGEAMGREQTALLLDIMVRCATGRKRLKGLLPSGTRVAHKTGSLPGGVYNDVGIIDLPDGAGRVAIAVFVIKPRRPEKEYELLIAEKEHELVIARIGRAVYDYFGIHHVRPNRFL
jgi:beta-lactamase class A